MTNAHAHYVASLMFGWLQQGLSLQDAYRELGSAARLKEGVELTTNGRDIRIRDLVRAHDGVTGQEVKDGSTVQPSTLVGDGEADVLLLDLTVDGIVPEKIAHYAVSVFNDGKKLVTLPWSGVEQLADFSFRFTGEVPLGFAAQGGEPLNLTFSVDLPEGGHSRRQAKPSIVQAQALPASFLMNSTNVDKGTGGAVRTTTAIWVLKPGQDAHAPYRDYVVKEGTMSVQRSYRAGNCQFDYSEVVPIPPNESNTYLRIHLDSQPMVVVGMAFTKGKEVEVQGRCDFGGPLKKTVSIGGDYFLSEGVQIASPRSFSGVYDNGAPAGSVIHWTFEAAAPARVAVRPAAR